MKRFDAILMFAVVVFCGCGTQKYQDRLKRTNLYYKYLEELDTNLSERRWNAQGISLRVPLQFKLVKSDKKKAAKKRGDDKQKKDAKDGPPPIPPALMRLEGVLGRWSCSVAVDGKDKELPCFMVVAGNHHLWQREKINSAAAAKFEERFVRQFYALAGEPMPMKKNWKEKQIPDSGSFVERLPFFTFKATRIVGLIGSKEEYDGILYTHARGGIQVAILFIIPHDTAANERLSESKRISLCLQTLKFASAESSRGSRRKPARPKRKRGELDF